MPPGVAEGSVFRARGAIYGTRDAGREWWLFLVEKLVQFGWTESKLEPALFLFWDGCALKGLLAAWDAKPAPKEPGLLAISDCS